ncbi:hypothetical protein C0416_04635 [bacterium]|nr:hypothetical protein [bacterium]
MLLLSEFNVSNTDFFIFSLINAVRIICLLQVIRNKNPAIKICFILYNNKNNHLKMKKNNLIPICLTALVAFPVLTGCSNQDSIPAEGGRDSQGDASETISQTQETYLAVDPNKCIGCGHCIKSDYAHFIMDSETKKAVVISQSDLGSDKLASAIGRCPVDAITL